MNLVSVPARQQTNALQDQLQQLQQRVQLVVPAVVRLTCERVDGGDQGPISLFDSGAAAPAAGRDGQVQGASLLLPVGQNGTPHCVVGFHASQAEGFSAVEQATLSALADLIGLTVHNHFQAVAALDVAARVAHEFAVLRDFETGSHLNRVAKYARLIAEGLAERHGLSATYVDQVGRFSRLHDIGKIGISDAILLKEGALNAEERVVMNTHVELGLAMIEKVLGQHNLLDLPGAQVLRNVIGHHHERLDGSGYPLGLSGDQISLEGRIVAVADVFDAVTNDRSYRKGLPVEAAFVLLEEQVRGGLLDSECVAGLAGCLSR